MFDLFALGSLAGFNRDPTRLHRLGHFSDQVDLQEPVLERGAFHLDEIGQPELTPEGTAKDTLVEIGVVTFVSLAAAMTPISSGAKPAMANSML